MLLNVGPVQPSAPAHRRIGFRKRRAETGIVSRRRFQSPHQVLGNVSAALHFRSFEESQDFPVQATSPIHCRPPVGSLSTRAPERPSARRKSRRASRQEGLWVALLAWREWKQRRASWPAPIPATSELAAKPGTPRSSYSPERSQPSHRLFRQKHPATDNRPGSPAVVHATQSGWPHCRFAVSLLEQ